MKKAVKKIFIFLAIITTLFTITFIFARDGWKLFGFSMCDSSETIFAEDITVSDDEVNIKGGIGDSASAFVGYIYKIDDGNIYIGVNHNLFLGFFSRIGEFKISINTGKAEIDKIYFKDSKSKKLIWTKEKGQIGNSQK